jgi:hypothetical protein
MCMDGSDFSCAFNHLLLIVFLTLPRIVAIGIVLRGAAICIGTPHAAVSLCEGTDACITRALAIASGRHAHGRECGEGHDYQ